MRFGPKGISSGGSSPSLAPDHGSSSVPRSSGAPRTTGAGSSRRLPRRVQADTGEEALFACAEHVKLANPTRLRSDINFLKKYAENEISEDRRKRYRDVITRLGLLRHDFLVEEKCARKSFTTRCSGWPSGCRSAIEAYCQMEKCAGIATGDAPHPELLAAIIKAGMADTVVSTIVYWHLREPDEKKLTGFWHPDRRILSR